MQRLAAIIAYVVVVASPVAAQVIDRVLSRVEGHAITALDVRRAEMLRLVDARDADVLAVLEDRRLKLLDIARLPAPPPTPEEIAARRRAWEAALGGDVEQKLTQAGMTPTQLDAWMAEDLRIAKYEEQRFSGAQDRAAAIARWTADLRRRYGLPERR
jgi:hypothetical protein